MLKCAFYKATSYKSGSSSQYGNFISLLDHLRHIFLHIQNLWNQQNWWLGKDQIDLFVAKGQLTPVEWLAMSVVSSVARDGMSVVTRLEQLMRGWDYNCRLVWEMTAHISCPAIISARPGLQAVTPAPAPLPTRRTTVRTSPPGCIIILR